MWYAKMYFSEKKEVFQFDSYGVQGVPSTYKELPFLESLLSFLEMDCDELTPSLRRIAESWELSLIHIFSIAGLDFLTALLRKDSLFICQGSTVLIAEEQGHPCLLYTSRCV